MVGIAPLLIGSFAVNFNNFILIYLLTDGGPPIADGCGSGGAHRHPGHVHLWTCHISQGAGQQFGLAVGADSDDLPDRDADLGLQLPLHPASGADLWQP